MSLTDQLKPNEALDPPNEVLLNLLRESHPRGLGTSAIVNEVDLGNDAVRDRLRGLEAEGLVESQTIGSEDDYSFIWYLADGVRKRSVNPEIVRLVHWCENLKSGAKIAFEVAKPIVLGGVIVILLTLTALLQGLPLGGLTPELLLFGGWATVLVGVSLGFGAYAVIFVAVITEWSGERLVEREARDE